MNTATDFDNRETESMYNYLESRIKALELRVRELEALTDGGYREQGK